MLSVTDRGCASFFQFYKGFPVVACVRASSSYSSVLLPLRTVEALLRRSYGSSASDRRSFVAKRMLFQRWSAYVVRKSERQRYADRAYGSFFLSRFWEKKGERSFMSKTSQRMRENFLLPAKK